MQAARADGAQQAARLVADDEEDRLLRRLLDELQQGVCGGGVEFVRRIDDGDAPAPGACRLAEEALRLARVVNRDLGLEALVLEVHGALDDEQARMGAGSHLAEGRLLRCDVERAVCPRLLRRRDLQQELGEAVGERCLADAAGARDQPGMMQLAGLVGLQQPRLCRRMAEEFGGAAGVPGDLARVLEILRHQSAPLDDGPDVVRDGLLRLCGVDEAAAGGVAAQDVEEAFAELGVEGEALALIPVLGGGIAAGLGARKARLRGRDRRSA